MQNNFGKGSSEMKSKKDDQNKINSIFLGDFKMQLNKNNNYFTQNEYRKFNDNNISLKGNNSINCIVY